MKKYIITVVYNGVKKSFDQWARSKEEAIQEFGIAIGESLIDCEPV